MLQHEIEGINAMSKTSEMDQTLKKNWDRMESSKLAKFVAENSTLNSQGLQRHPELSQYDALLQIKTVPEGFAALFCVIEALHRYVR